MLVFGTKATINQDFGLTQIAICTLNKDLTFSIFKLNDFSNFERYFRFDWNVFRPVRIDLFYSVHNVNWLQCVLLIPLRKLPHQESNPALLSCYVITFVSSVIFHICPFWCLFEKSLSSYWRCILWYNELAVMLVWNEHGNINIA